MAVEAVPGYGQITKANAPMIYRDRKVYDKLSEDQKHLVDRYVPDEQKDEIDYEIRKTNGKENGKNKVEDNKKAEAHDGQGANAATTSIAGDAFAAAVVVLASKCKKITEISGFSALGGAIAMMACAAGSMVCSSKFDNGYKDRTSASGNYGNTNDTLDTQASALQSSMDMMDQDVQEYLDGSNKLMKETNDNNSKLADLQVQYADCQAAGDTAGAERLKGEIKQRHDNKFDKEQEELDEKKKGIDDYRIMSDETDGVIEGGTNVSEFLKEGTPLGALATFNAVLLATAMVWSGILIASSFKTGAKETAKWNWPGAAAAWAAAAMYAVTLVLLGKSSSTMASKAKAEFECGSHGRDVEGHVNALSDMKDSQANYIDQTEETYTEEDEQRTETVEEGEEMANGNSTSNRGQVISYKPYGQDDDDKGSNGKKKGKNKAGAKA